MSVFYVTLDVEGTVKKPRVRVEVKTDEQSIIISAQTTFLVKEVRAGDYGTQNLNEQEQDIRYFCSWHLSSLDGKILLDKFNDDDLVLLDPLMKEAIEKGLHDIVHDAYAKATSHKESWSTLRENISQLLKSDIPPLTIAKDTQLPQNTVYRIFNGEASLDNVTLKNAEILSAYWEKVKQ